MQTPNSPDRKHLAPVAAAAIVAAAGIAAALFMHFGPGDSQSGAVSMITTAVADKAGATVIPTVPQVQPAVPPRR